MIVSFTMIMSTNLGRYRKMARVRVIATEEHYDDVEIITTDDISPVGGELLSEIKPFENGANKYVIRCWDNDAIRINNYFYLLWDREEKMFVHF